MFYRVFFSIAACTVWCSFGCYADGFDLQSLDRDLWMRTDISQSVPHRLFWLVPYASKISGSEATKETWETEGYEKTFPILIHEARVVVERVAEVYLEKNWRPTGMERSEGIHLVPARLQPDWNHGQSEEDMQLVTCSEYLGEGRYAEPKEHYSGKPDRLYCSYDSPGRRVLLTVTNGPGCGVGISVPLMREEQELLDARNLDELGEFLDGLLHTILISDPLAPYSIELQRDAQSGSIAIRGRQDIPGALGVPDTDANPTHWMSALAGTVENGRLVVVLPGDQFYFDPKKNKRICRIPPAAFAPTYPGHYFDRMIGKEFRHKTRQTNEAKGE